ncbi:MAG: hypothetical protein J5I52_11075 [Saprospiraceae bacterium]|nr:MAG: hypothetical protein UZ09_BCD002002430 [Bacteroidetes bacterium OLB9]MCO6464676.1 hypothetical protein [Saprospiraceae bacterium]MCZ2339310.1 hypothetical protein [Chitinophagales bacterium]
MILKYILVSLVVYYIYVNYFRPRINSPKDHKEVHNTKRTSSNNYKGEYVDYEELD